MSIETPTEGDREVEAVPTWRLVVPDGWVLHEVARERLEEAVARVPDDVVALGAVLERPGPGVSGRVHAERRSLAVERVPSLPSARPPADGGYAGAVLVRGDVAAEPRRAGVVLAEGVVVVDVPGAVAHDPWQPPDPLRDASRDGRPPFPCRPVVLFLGLEDDIDHADAARGLANGIDRRDVEGRLAVPTVPEGLLLAEPCAPTETTVRALRPEVIVVLDDEAAAAAERWARGMRGTVVVELTRDIAMDVELVSWRLGVAQGRLRARIGPRTRPRHLAELVNRLVAGPQPEAPTEPSAEPRPPIEAGSPVSLGPLRGRPSRRTRRHVVVVHPPQGPTRRSSGLAAHLAANDWRVATGEPALVAGEASGAHLVVGDATSVLELLGLGFVPSPGRTVVDLVPGDLAPGPGPGGAHGEHPFADDHGWPAVGDAAGSPPPTLGAAAHRACAVAGAAIGATTVLLEAARGAGARALLVPDLYPADVLEAYATARRHADRQGDPVVGWTLSALRPDPAVLDAVGRAVVGLLAQGVHLDLVVAPRVAAALDEQLAPVVAHPAVRLLSERPGPTGLASWWGQLWAPGPGAVDRTGDLSTLVEAAAAGVPTVASAWAVGAGRGLLDPAMVVHEPTRAGAWHAAVRPALSEGGRDAARRLVHDRVVALHGRLAGASIVRRLDSWLEHGRVPT